ncbi:MAG: protein phosphatase 2C domain-containing protein [Sphingomonadales bacterium]|nr:MAG: protein phosphatase 2C domain-containing protein [Sphingomonadales bacterium]
MARAARRCRRRRVRLRRMRIRACRRCILHRRRSLRRVRRDDGLARCPADRRAADPARRPPRRQHRHAPDRRAPARWPGRGASEQPGHIGPAQPDGHGMDGDSARRQQPRGRSGPSGAHRSRCAHPLRQDHRRDRRPLRSGASGMSAGDTWIAGGASVRGAAHVRRGQPNQDAIAWRPELAASRVIGAVSDGHGASAHFRSDTGSAIAAACAVETLSWQLDEAGTDESDAAVAGDLLDCWRRQVSAHLAAHPYSEAEALIPQSSALAPYGATLAAFAASETILLALHIGDGDLVIGYPDGRLERPLRSDTGLAGEETYSLCLPDAAHRFRVATLWLEEGRPQPDFLFAASDGISKSFESDAAFLGAVRALRERARGDWAALQQDLPSWLQEITERGSGDDCTACIATRITKGGQHG